MRLYTGQSALLELDTSPAATHVSPRGHPGWCRLGGVLPLVFMRRREMCCEVVATTTTAFDGWSAVWHTVTPLGVLGKTLVFKDMLALPGSGSSA